MFPVQVRRRARTIGTASAWDAAHSTRQPGHVWFQRDKSAEEQGAGVEAGLNAVGPGARMETLRGAVVISGDHGGSGGHGGSGRGWQMARAVSAIPGTRRARRMAAAAAV